MWMRLNSIICHSEHREELSLELQRKILFTRYTGRISLKQTCQLDKILRDAQNDKMLIDPKFYNI
jgi:hypothetical protein